MKEYVCTVCGYVHKGELPKDFRCPVCGAGAGAFREVVKAGAVKPTRVVKKPARETESELSAIEMSIICSNLARGCEKQYMFDAMEKFNELAEFFRKAAKPVKGVKNAEALAAVIGKDIDEGYPYANAEAKSAGDRGAMRSLVWSEKVTRMLASLLARYAKEGDKMLENTGVYVCSVCGFVYVGDSAPALCPVCKVPAWKFEKQERRAR